MLHVFIKINLNACMHLADKKRWRCSDMRGRHLFLSTVFLTLL